MKKVNPEGYLVLTLIYLLSASGLTTADAQITKDSLHKFNFQISPSVSYDLYHFKNTTSNNTITLNGFGGELGLGAFYHLNKQWDLGGRLRLDYVYTGATTTTSSSDTTTSSSATSHQGYRFFNLGFDPTVLLRVNDKWIINAGPSVAFNLSAKYRNYGTVTETSGGVSTSNNFGSTSYSNLDGVKKNIQFGVNAGVAYRLNATGVPVQPFLKVSIPLNNTLDVSEKNHLYGVNVGVNIGIGGGGGTTTEHLHTVEKEGCKADTNTHEFKTEFTVVEKVAKKIQDVLEKIPRVDSPKVTIKPLLTVKRGEECCSTDGPPISYTELKAGVQGGFEVTFNLYGPPKIAFTYNLWAAKIVGKLEATVFITPVGKINLEAVGKFYGKLFDPTPHPNCKACLYFNIKAECLVKGGIRAGGSLKIYYWSPFSEGADGYDLNGPPDEEVTATAEAGLSVATSFNGTWAGIGECPTPPQGVHGTFNFGKLKAFLKFNLKLGPIAFNYTYEYLLWEGFDYKL